MKLKSIAVMACLFSFVVMVHEGSAKTPKKYQLKTKSEKLGYSLGLDIGKSFKKNDLPVDKDAFIRGLLDGLSGKNPLLSDEEIRSIQQAAIMEMRIKLSGKRQIWGESNRKNGAAYCAENAKRRHVTTTPSGLQYEILEKGEGPIPKITDKVHIHYIGTQIDGEEFDSSEPLGKPATFNVGGVIPGMTEALLMMPVGSKWRIVLPSDLAYKEQGAGSKIGPNATLIFEIELVGIEAAMPEGEPLDDAVEPEKTDDVAPDEDTDTITSDE